MALVMVLAVVAMATVFGYALLSATSLQAQVTGNSARSASADYLAESGLHAAMYYLQYPQRMPSGWDTTPGYVIRATNQSLGASSLGSFDIEVTRTATRNTYDITATGRSPTGAVTKAAAASVYVDRVNITNAGYFGGPITFPVRTTVSGAVQAAGTVTNLTGNVLTALTVTAADATALQAPSLTTINWYGTDGVGSYTTPDGTVGYPQQLTSVPTSTPTPAANNPGAVFYYVGDLTLTSPVTIEGTLVVKNGTLTVRALGVNIRAKSGYPALIVEKDLSMYRTSVSLETEGSVFVGRNISWVGLSNTGSTLTIKGALLMPAGSSIGAPYSGGAQTFTYTAGKSDVVDLTTTMQPGKNVKILSWDQ